MGCYKLNVELAGEKDSMHDPKGVEAVVLYSIS